MNGPVSFTARDLLHQPAVLARRFKTLLLAWSAVLACLASASPALAEQPNWQPYGAQAAPSGIALTSPQFAPSTPMISAPPVIETLWIDGASWHENFSIFKGLEGSKQPQDFGVNAQFGGRIALQGTMPLIDAWEIGLQVGTSLNATANAVQVVERIEGTHGRTQSFSTVGIFQRLDSGLLWGAGYDFLYQDYYDNFYLTQSRAKVGYAFSIWNEVGIQAAVGDRGSQGNFGPIPVTLRAINQGSLYWRHTFDNGATLGSWGGISGPHGQVNVALGDLPRTHGNFVFGSDAYVPLTRKIALYGEANFITPADSGTVDAFLGIEWRPWGNTLTARRNRYAAVLPQSGSTTFSTDLTR